MYLTLRVAPALRVRNVRHFGYRDTLSYRLYGPRKTVMVIHPMLHARNKPRLTHLLEADEAIGLARAAKLDVIPGPSEPRMGWENERIDAMLVPPSDNAVSEYVTVKDSDSESDDEMDMDDPLWNDPSVRKQYVESTLVRLDRVDPVWFFGQGKVEEIAVAISRMPPRFVFINATLTNAQMRQLEESFYGGLLSFLSARKQKYLETARLKQMVGYRGEDEAQKYEERISSYIPKSIEVIDRPRMILEIFSSRADSPLAKLQCDIAKMHFTKANLGVGNLRKAREILNSLHTSVTPFKEIPITVDDGGVKVDNSGYSFTEHKEKVDTLLRKLNIKMDQARKARLHHRLNRAGAHVTVGLVGYTNAGKSQLLNQLVGREEVRVRNLLFQTLDSSTRSIELPNGSTILVTDSIGFVRDLPHFLFQAFKTTIEDLIACDFLIHVRDIAHPLREEQAETVRSALLDAGLNKRDLEERIIEVWNKIDDVHDQGQLETLLDANPQVVPISALTGQGIDNLLRVLQAVATRLKGNIREKLHFPLKDMNSHMKMLRALSDVVYEDTLDCDESGNFMSVDVLIRTDALEKYKAEFLLIE